MTDEKKPLKITFAPGCFDDFDGTQEELDELIGQITEIFTNNTPEEIEAMSQPVEFDGLDGEFDEIFNEIENTMSTERKLH